MEAGMEKLAWFSRLKISARNCSFVLSPRNGNAVSLFSQRSQVLRPGPRNIPREPLPRNPAGASRNMSGLNQPFGSPVITLFFSKGVNVEVTEPFTQGAAPGKADPIP